MIKGNKGEWSEIYALFRILGEGKIHAGDANLKRLRLFYPIIKIIRDESKLKHCEYCPDTVRNIVVIDENGNEFAKIPMDVFIKESSYLLDKIKTANKSSFPVPNTESFMGTVGCSKLKAPSKDKADIHIVIHDLRTNMTPLLGFSIKSQLGSPSTLLNPGLPTNITYEVVGGKMPESDIQEINNVKDHLPRMQKFLDKGYSLKYADIEHKTFKNNLLFLDMCMPSFIGDCLLNACLPQNDTSIREVVKAVAKENPFSFEGKDTLSFYEHKMKVLLIDSALGMTAAKEWKGRYDANGGYLVVKKDGDIVCYHFYNRNDVEDYLFNNTRIDRPSRKRYDFGYLYKGDDGKVYMKLNLQIRFNK